MIYFIYKLIAFLLFTLGEHRSWNELALIEDGNGNGVLSLILLSGLLQIHYGVYIGSFDSCSIYLFQHVFSFPVPNLTH